jgi:hypothetical protein
MGWKFYSLDSLPDPYAIVWSKWPRREDKLMPGPVARPVLVRESMILEDQRTKTRYGALIISYATGQLEKGERGAIDLIIDDWAEVKAAGLHKPTRFSLDPRDRKQLPWCEEYFVAPEYVRAQNVVAGALSASQIDRLRACLAKRRGE